MTTLPPGPRLPSWVQTAVVLRHWPRFVAWAQRRYGDVFTLRVASVGTIVYLADPAAIKTVFAGDPAVYHAGEANAMLGGLIGDSSVLLLDDELHHDRRRLMMPPFARDAVARQTDVIAQAAAANIATWPVGVDFPVAPKMAAITLEVILRTVVGATDPARLAALRAAMPRILNLGPWATLAIANPKLQSKLPWRHVRRRMPRSPIAAPTRIWRSAPTCWRCWCAPPTTAAAT